MSSIRFSGYEEVILNKVRMFIKESLIWRKSRGYIIKSLKKFVKQILISTHSSTASETKIRSYTTRETNIDNIQDKPHTKINEW